MKNIEIKKLHHTYTVYGLMGSYVAALMYKILLQGNSDFISLHISNFAITGLIISTEMFKSVRKGEYNVSKLHSIILISVILNIVVEAVNINYINLPFGVTWVDFNTADPGDALFGIVAALLFLAVMKLCTVIKK